MTAQLILVFGFIRICFGSESTNLHHGNLMVCEGSEAVFAWPCDLHDLAEVMTLTFYGASSESQLVAMIVRNRSVEFTERFAPRARQRGTTGIYLNRMGILDSGVYSARAEFCNGTVLERQFFVSVNVPPLLSNNGLDLEVSNSSQHCQTITCRKVLFPGYPSVSFILTTPSGPEIHDHWKGTASKIGCPLLPGNYSCHLTGPALACLSERVNTEGKFSHMLFSQTLQLSGHDSNGEATASAEKDALELILVIVVPIVTVTFPMMILGLWILKHLCNTKSYTDAETSLCLPAKASCSRMPETPSHSSTKDSSETVPLASSADDPQNDDQDEKYGNEESKKSRAKGGDADDTFCDHDNAGQVEEEFVPPSSSNTDDRKLPFM